MKKFYYMLLLAVISMAISSCSEWDSPYYYNESIVGSWESYYGYNGYGEYDLRGYDVVRYEFYGNYWGRYYYYSRLGMLNYLDFEWETRGSRLYIWYEDGDYDELYYGFNEYRYLVLSKSRHFNQYVVYRPIGIYYQQEKGLDTEQQSNQEGQTEQDKQ